ncbi:MAG: hypothetical protein K8T89_08305 [Planctomycetes bacterium]|nr:hypothetical protein [Planctomycetota bacterium]
MIFALFIAGVLLLLAIVSIRRQARNLRRLRNESHLPSDDRSYLRNQAYRRIATGILMLGLAGMLAGTFLSGMEKRIEQHRDFKNPAENEEQRKEQAEARELARFYLLYWATILILLFIVVSLAIIDLLSTRRYAWVQMRRIQSEHRVILERDLAMYRQQKDNDRIRQTGAE